VSAGSLVKLSATAPTEGLTGAEVATITAIFQRIVEPKPAIGDELQELTIELLCVSDPIAWVVT
jgi:hypothetical protein